MCSRRTYPKLEAEAASHLFVVVFTFVVAIISRSLEASRELPRHFDVTRLRSFVSAGEENDQFVPSGDEIDAVAWPIVNSHFGDSLTNRPRVSGIAERARSCR